MSYTVLLHPKAAEFLERCDEHLRLRVKNRLRELEREPEAKGKPIRHSHFRNLRIGNYRAIYMVEKEDRRVIVLFIGHRRDVYDDFSRIF